MVAVVLLVPLVFVFVVALLWLVSAAVLFGWFVFVSVLVVYVFLGSFVGLCVGVLVASLIQYVSPLFLASHTAHVHTQIDTDHTGTHAYRPVRQ